MRRTCVALSVVLSLVTADAAHAAPRPRLKAFTSCRQLVDYARAGALRTQGGAGVTPRAAPVPTDAIVTPPLVPQTRQDTAAAAPAPDAGGSAPEFSGTNTQEIGVDEPDIVKTDGKRVFAVTDRTL